MITKEDAIEIGGTRRELYSSERLGSDQRPIRARINGRCKTWKRTPERWSLPAKHGLKTAFRIEPEWNAHLWYTDELDALAVWIVDHEVKPAPGQSQTEFARVRAELESISTLKAHRGSLLAVWREYDR